LWWTGKTNGFRIYFRTSRSSASIGSAVNGDRRRRLSRFSFIRTLSVNGNTEAHVRSPAECRRMTETKWMTDVGRRDCECASLCARTRADVHCREYVCAVRALVCECVCVCDRGWHLNEANGIDFPRRHWYPRDGRPSSSARRRKRETEGDL